ncbi:Putative gustatory receptor 64f [Apis cerana cerana]|uniref:Gustatory receptor n=1 Tax=Apis cerana cerana TaxID=94128 RepID=A0A2A3E4L7_APICC|nr:Putative gustatory receptor 64f [Apis cerana cerana]
MHSEDQIQLMMLKTKDGLDEIPKGKGRGSNLKIWSSVIYHKNDNDIEDISANQENDLSTKRSQGERNYFRNSEALENFHCAIGPVLKAAQIFGMFPVSGVGSSSLSKLQFKIFSFLTIYSGFIALMVSFMTIVSMIHMLKTFNANTFQIRVNYNFVYGLYVFVVSKLATFTWNFTDLFIMLVATGLAERYKSLNKKLAITMTKCQTAFNWRELREDYAILSCIVKKVDDHISPIILLSFANNVYFICLQLLNGLSISDENSVLSEAYFFGSFAFLICRTCAVTLLTARIHDQSKQALPYLYNCSTSSYSVEVQRLQYQLATDDIALTGLRFFSITRNFMLAVAGAIITYEVVLLQFNGK